MTKKKEAQIVAKAFTLLLEQARKKATNGCNKSALELIRYMTVEAGILRDLGYMTNESGRVVKFKPWKAPDWGQGYT